MPWSDRARLIAGAIGLEGRRKLTEARRLTEAERELAIRVLQLGCPRETAASLACARLATFENELAQNPQFAQEVVRAESAAELQHMKNIHAAAQEPKNWRSSAWWLERREAQRSVAADTPATIEALVDALAAVIAAEVKDPAIQRRVIEKLLAVSQGGQRCEEDADDETRKAAPSRPAAGSAEMKLLGYEGAT